MKRWFKRPNKKTVGILLTSLSMIPLVVIVFWVLGIIFTYTGSIPVGFYRIVANSRPIQRGDIIAFCLPDKVVAMGFKRGYLRHGACKNGSEKLIKQVVAVPGDMVTLSHDQIIVNGVNMKMGYFAPTHVIDKAHLPVYRFIQDGIYHIKGYWVYGFGDPRYSWDSRYYGGIPRKNVSHRLVPLWLF